MTTTTKGMVARKERTDAVYFPHWSAGKTKEEIASATGVTPAAVARWLTSRGLVDNGAINNADGLPVAEGEATSDGVTLSYQPVVRKRRSRPPGSKRVESAPSATVDPNQLTTLPPPVDFSLTTILSRLEALEAQSPERATVAVEDVLIVLRAHAKVLSDLEARITTLEARPAAAPVRATFFGMRGR